MHTKNSSFAQIDLVKECQVHFNSVYVFAQTLSLHLRLNTFSLASKMKITYYKVCSKILKLCDNNLSELNLESLSDRRELLFLKFAKKTLKLNFFKKKITQKQQKILWYEPKKRMKVFCESC